jgi:hypothetical protein
MMTHHRDALSINVSTWDQTQNIVTTTDLYPTTLSQGREDYGSSAECLSPGSSITRIDASDVKPSCTTYTADKLWRSRFVPITRNNRTVFWRATAGSDTRSPASSTTPAKSCRDSTQGFRCELVTLDLNNGVIAATKVERQALDYQNIDRGFFGSHWMTERHDGNRGVIYLSNRYFE